jgi:2-oxoglutarate ferredoxin oxidoreductase subunit gamma
VIQTDLYEELVIAGFGGQGVLLSGKLLAHAAMEQGLQVTYMPSYGPEVRGGTANCMVIMAGEPIACPIISRPDAAIVMNQASLDRFGPKLKPGGLIVLNSSLVKTPSARSDIEVVSIPADEIAVKLGAPRSANMVALGCYLQKRNIMTPQHLSDCLKFVLAKRHLDTIAVNQQAIEAGAKFI